jgi:hypothetical protein
MIASIVTFETEKVQIHFSIFWEEQVLHKHITLVIKCIKPI